MLICYRLTPTQDFTNTFSNFLPGLLGDVTETLPQKNDPATWWPKVGTGQQYWVPPTCLPLGLLYLVNFKEALSFSFRFRGGDVECNFGINYRVLLEGQPWHFFYCFLNLFDSFLMKISFLQVINNFCLKWSLQKAHVSQVWPFKFNSVPDSDFITSVSTGLP